MKWKVYYAIDATKTLEVVFTQVLETNLLQKVLLPPLDTAINAHRHVSLLTHDRAETPRLIARSQVRQRIRQIIELALVELLLGHIVLQPQHLRDLHLDAHLAAHIPQQVVVGGIDLLGLLDGAVVKPQHDVAVVAVAVVEVGSCHCYGLVGF